MQRALAERKYILGFPCRNDHTHHASMQGLKLGDMQEPTWDLKDKDGRIGDSAATYGWEQSKSRSSFTTAMSQSLLEMPTHIPRSEFSTLNNLSMDYNIRYFFEPPWFRTQWHTSDSDGERWDGIGSNSSTVYEGIYSPPI